MVLHLTACVFKIGNRILAGLTFLLAFSLFLYSGYVLYDTFYLNRTAFSTWDLLQFRPDPKAEETDGFAALCRINPDVVGWIELEGTHINYPVLQGPDDLHYAYTDAYGNASMNGSIYLSSENNPSFSDTYIMIYGHNMANGGMFGDLQRYRDTEFFRNHRTGLLTTKDAVYNLEIFACINTDAYERMVYTLGNRSAKSLGQLCTYIQNHAAVYEPIDAEDFFPILAFSTCSSAQSYGRTVVFSRLLERQERNAFEMAAQPESEDPTVENRKAVGHTVNNNRFSLVNLLAVLSMAYLLVPLGKCRSKYAGQGETCNSCSKSRYRLQIPGLIMETVVFAAGATFFFFRENLNDPLTLVNQNTPVLLAMMLADLFFETMFFRIKKEGKTKWRQKDDGS